MRSIFLRNAPGYLELLRVYVMKLPFYIHVPYPFSAIELSENGFALGQGNGFGVIQKALVLQGFSASQTEKNGKNGRVIPN